MFIDYATLVLKDYNQKKDNGLLSIRLSQPSPAKIREQCLAMLDGDLCASDEQILRTFFGSATDKNGLARNIKNFDIDKLKPLINYLKNPKIKTDEKNVELLAWLIAFQNRPFKHGYNYDLNLDVSEKIDSNYREDPSIDAIEPIENIKQIVTVNELAVVEPVAQIEKNESLQKNKLSWLGKWKKQIVVIVILLVGIIISIQWFRSKNDEPLSARISLFSGSPEGKFMYWDGVQYQLVTEDKKLRDTPIFKLDTFKYNHLKRITTPDTITYEDKGHVWYIKINGDIEYYTSGGVHPVHTDRHLKPISNYMIKKYIRP